jgi:UDPglucose 6-dehydrogenase
MQPSVAIVGYGSVGRAVHALFPDAVIYDEPLGIGSRAAANECRFAFVAVPTPSGDDGACDVSIVEDVVGWLETSYIILLSTVAVGTTDRLRAATGKRIVFQPEYGPGETPSHPYSDLRKMTWLILGGDKADTVAVADLYKSVYNAEVTVAQTDSRTAELTKYMENAFLALKVTFCNEFYDIAAAAGVDYNDLRELWLLDPRIGRSHTFVMPDRRGYGGKCLPKDVNAIVQTAAALGCDPHLLASMIEANDRLRAANHPDRSLIDAL